MTDDEVRTIEQLLDKKLSDFREHVDERFGKIHQDGLRINERISKQTQSFHDDQTR